MCNSGPTQPFQTSAAPGPLPAPNLPSSTSTLTSSPIVKSSKYSTHTNSDQCRCQLFWFEEIYVNVIPRLLLQNLLLSRPLLNLIHLTVQSLVLSQNSNELQCFRLPVGLSHQTSPHILRLLLQLGTCSLGDRLCICTS
jgi:hypothetical protein